MHRSPLSNVGRGAVMGAADLVPGVSGGTMALILGIHPRLVAAIAAVDAALPGDAWRALRGDKEARASLARLDLPLLVPLAVGIVSAVFLGAGIVHAALIHAPAAAMAFFVGLLVISLRVPWRHVSQKEAGVWVTAAGGTAVAAALVYLPGSSWPLSFLGLAGAGCIAFTAMLLPGISGSGLLVLLGVYEVVLAAAAERDLATLIPVALGGAVGLALASRALRWLFAHHHDRTFAFLTGLLAGSILRVWPWRTAPGFSAGLPALPDGPVSSVALLLLFAVAGALLVQVVDLWARQPEQQ